MGRTLDLEGGQRARLRLARSSDARAIGDLLARQGISFDEVSPRGLVQYDPRERYVVCATALIDGAERLVGVGAIDLMTGADPEPDLLISELGGSLALLLRRALIRAAQARLVARAA